jgi:membrane glycosyltransferase
MMLIQNRQVWEILFGHDSGWASQRRGHGTTPWPEVVRRHWMHMLLGLGVSLLLAVLSPALLAWMSPTLVGLVLALPLSKGSGSTAAGGALRRLGLLLTPEEIALPPVMRRQQECVAEIQQAVDAAGLRQMVADRRAQEIHFAAVLAAPEPTRGQPDPDRLTAAAKVAQARDTDEALGWLSRGERLAVLADRTLFAQIPGPSASSLSEPGIERRGAGMHA